MYKARIGQENTYFIFMAIYSGAPPMTLDLAKIKSDAEKVAANSDLLLMALPVKDVLGMLAEIERLKEEVETLGYELLEAQER